MAASGGRRCCHRKVSHFTLNRGEPVKTTQLKIMSAVGFTSHNHSTGAQVLYGAGTSDAQGTQSLCNVVRLPAPATASPSPHCRCKHAACPRSRRRTVAGPCCRQSCSCRSPRLLGRSRRSRSASGSRPWEWYQTSTSNNTHGLHWSQTVFGEAKYWYYCGVQKALQELLCSQKNPKGK